MNQELEGASKSVGTLQNFWECGLPQRECGLPQRGGWRRIRNESAHCFRAFATSTLESDPQKATIRIVCKLELEMQEELYCKIRPPVGLADTL